MGFKPMTFRTGIWRSIQLSYGALFPAKIRLSIDLTKRFFYFIPLPYTGFGTFAPAPAILTTSLPFAPNFSQKNSHVFRKISNVFQKKLPRFLESLPRFLPNIGDKIWDQPASHSPHSMLVWQQLPTTANRGLWINLKTPFSRVRARASTEILHFLLSQPSQISLQLPHPQRETRFFRTYFNILDCFSSQDGENSPKNAPRKARTEHWKITRRKKTQRAVVPSVVKVVKAKSASLQGMRARDTRVRETRLLYSTTPPPLLSKPAHYSRILQTRTVIIVSLQRIFVTFPRFLLSLGAYLPIYL